MVHWRMLDSVGVWVRWSDAVARLTLRQRRLAVWVREKCILFGLMWKAKAVRCRCCWMYGNLSGDRCC